MEHALAVAVVTELRKFSEPINRLKELSEGLENERGKEMRQNFGRVMFEIDDVWRPIAREFPDLDPGIYLDPNI